MTVECSLISVILFGYTVSKPLLTIFPLVVVGQPLRVNVYIPRSSKSRGGTQVSAEVIFSPLRSSIVHVESHMTFIVLKVGAIMSLSPCPSLSVFLSQQLIVSVLNE